MALSYRYDWLFLRTIVTVGYLGWIAYALVTVINSHVLHGQEAPIRNWTSFSFFSSILVALFSVLLVQRSSWTYYAYAFFPVFFWEGVFARRNSLSKGCGELFAHLHSVGSYVGLVVKTLGFFAVLETMVCRWSIPCSDKLHLTPRLTPSTSDMCPTSEYRYGVTTIERSSRYASCLQPPGPFFMGLHS